VPAKHQWHAQHLNAYNARNLEAFLIHYIGSVELYDFPSKLFAKGKAAMQAMHAETFTVPDCIMKL